MCLIIDTCTFTAVFNPDNKHHNKFAPVRDWLNKGRGKMIYGGNKYNDELKGGLFLGVLLELKRKGRLVKINDADVDRIAADLKKAVNNVDFDDEHILAMVIVSKCCVVCTSDKRALPFLKNRNLYPRGHRRPKIYSSARNASLCHDKNVVKICQ